jgi:predicted PurR-regulated permease PerM
MSEKPDQITLAISRQSVIKIVLFCVILASIIYLRYLIVTVLLAFILASFAKYFANLINRRYGVPVTTGLIVIFFIISVIILSSISLLFPIIIKEGYGLFQVLTDFLKQFEDQLSNMGIPFDIESLKQFSSLFPNLGRVTLGIVGVFGQLLTYILLILVLGFYIAIDKTGVFTIVRLCVPHHIKDDIPTIVNRLQYHIGKWAFVEGIIALMMGVFIYIILTILGIEYAVLLALFTGIGQLIPFIGPIIVGSIIILYAFVQSPLLAIFIIILLIVLQIIKQVILLPIVFNTVKRNNPLLIIIALMVGGVIAGPLGIIIAMPIVSLARIMYADIQYYD